MELQMNRELSLEKRNSDRAKEKQKEKKSDKMKTSDMVYGLLFKEMLSQSDESERKPPKKKEKRRSAELQQGIYSQSQDQVMPGQMYPP